MGYILVDPAGAIILLALRTLWDTTKWLISPCVRCLRLGGLESASACPEFFRGSVEVMVKFLPAKTGDPKIN